MTQKFYIGNQDFTSYLKTSGLKWSRNDIDASKSGRDKTGTMRRKRITTKRKLGFSCRTLKHSEIKALNQALDNETIQVTYIDPILDEVTKTFYGSSVECATQISQDGEILWEGATFNLIEV